MSVARSNLRGLLRSFSPADDRALGALSERAWIAGRPGDGTVVQSGGTGGSIICPWTRSVIATGGICSVTIGIAGFGPLRLYHAQDQRINLFLNSTSPATQDVTVGTGSVAVSAIGTGYTLTTSAGTATISGEGAVTMGTTQVITVAVAGTITFTVAGTPVSACVNVEQAAFAGVKIVTAGSAITRTPDAIVWTPPADTPQNADVFHIGCQSHVDGDMGVAVQTWLRQVSPSLTILSRTNATTLNAADNDGVAVSDTITRTLPAKGIMFLQRWRRRTGSLEAGYGTAVSVSPTAMGTGAPLTTLRIGNVPAVERGSYAANGCIIVPGGASDAEVAALTRAVHLRPLSVVA